MATSWTRVPVTTSQHTELLDITDAVAAACRRDGADDGLVVVYCPHTTAGVLLQEAEPGLLADLQAWLGRVVSGEASYRHNRIDDNAASHLRSVVAGASAVVPLRGGRLGLGTWQRILFAELDGPRRREVDVGVLR